MTETTETATSTATGNETAARDVAGDPASAARPRIRFGAIAWGLIVCGIAVTVLLVIGSAPSRTAFVSWLGTLTPGGYVLIGVLAFGGLILLWGLLGLIRSLQRRPGRPISR